MTEVAQPGKPRQIQAFELRMNIIADATIDLLFTKNRVTCLFSSVFLLLSFFFANLCDLPSSLCCSLCLLSLDSYLSYSCWFMFYAFSNFLSQVVQGFSQRCVCDVHTKYQDKCMYKSRNCFFCQGRQSFLLLPLNLFYSEEEALFLMYL